MTTRPYNSCRAVMRRYAKEVGVCTQCFSRKVYKKRVQCLKCINAARVKRGAKPISRALVELKREYNKKYKKKKLYKKVRTLALIRNAVEKDISLDEKIST